MQFWTWMRERIHAEPTAWRGRHKLQRLPSRPTLRFRPRLEALEERCVPSTLTVTSPVDDVNLPGTLRYDIAHAQSGDTIRITPALQGAPIVLTQGELVLDKDLTIKAPKNHPVTISGNNSSRVFEVAAGVQVTLKNLNITEGNGMASNPSGTSADDGDGGGVLNLGTLTIRNSTLSDNSARIEGGGVVNFGTLTVNNSTLSGNSAAYYGGGIYNSTSGTVTIRNSTLSDNSATTSGGGIYNYQGANGSSAVTIRNSILADNSAFYGGGAYNFGTLSIDNSTVSDNSAAFGGGIYTSHGVSSPSTLTISNSTLSGNSASASGGGIYNSGLSGPSTVTISNSILSDNSAGNVDGGAIYTIGVSSTVTISNSILSGNSAGNDGGAIYNGTHISTVTISNCTLSDNSAGNDGGAIYNNHGTVIVGDSSFSDNDPDDIVGEYIDDGGNTFC